MQRLLYAIELALCVYARASDEIREGRRRKPLALPDADVASAAAPRASNN